MHKYNIHDTFALSNQCSNTTYTSVHNNTSIQWTPCRQRSFLNLEVSTTFLQRPLPHRPARMITFCTILATEWQHWAPITRSGRLMQTVAKQSALKPGCRPP